jgi:hypothetical protein
MTAINFCYDTERVLVASDSLVSTVGTHAPMGYASKVFAIPHLRVLVAGLGLKDFLDGYIFHLLGTRACPFEQVRAAAPEILRTAWSEIGEPTCSATIYLFGITASENVSITRYVSKFNFEPLQFPSEGGAYIHPGLRSTEVIQKSEVQVLEDISTGTVNDVPDSPVHWPWHDKVHSIMSALPLQRQQDPAQIGGRVQCSLLTPDCIHQHWMGDLDEMPAGAA